MTRARVAVAPLSCWQVKELRRWLGHAFEDDPMLRYVFPNRLERRERAAWLMACVARYGASFAIADTTPTLQGAAIWLPPRHRQMTWWGMGLTGMWFTPFAIGWSAWRRLAAYHNCSAALRERAIGEPHWYLLITAVDPRQQGLGLGRALLEYGIERVDRDDAACYLETTRYENLSYFERYGFRVAHSGEVRDGAFTVWSMVRPRGHVGGSISEAVVAPFTVRAEAAESRRSRE